MITKNIFGIVLVFCSYFSLTTSDLKVFTNFSDTESFEIQGRTSATSNGLELISSASSLSFKPSGDALELYVSSTSGEQNYIEISVNGNYMDKYLIEKQGTTSISIDLPSAEVNTIVVYKATEATSGGVLIHKIEAEDLGKIENNHALTIEFIGDSITCGMGGDTEEIPCGTGKNWFDQHSAYYSYGSQIALRLNANFTLSCVSGMGMYRNWNDEDQHVMPDVYNTLYLNADESNKWKPVVTPDIVSICLGTNDLSNGDGKKPRTNFSKEKFTQNYIDFVGMIYKKYPQIKVVLLNSPMVKGADNELLLECLQKVQNTYKNTNEIYLFKFRDINPTGCTTHPAIKEHAEMARQMVPKFKSIAL
ncbi:GDSL family lipase [Galbibacter sp. BG1]|uniref:SGNH/GDSL hydrolase family protein n=1 Tax=Galbibacter sp. BG1 TaxID=1170699 RepID=UPI0015BE31A8|nr:SGNH/GDSL hydrolase family protein [Galbibacter sp. BG1]QLE01970.1 GDSL family lipase [Galbibacter sp. BG1]